MTAKEISQLGADLPCEDHADLHDEVRGTAEVGSTTYMTCSRVLMSLSTLHGGYKLRSRIECSLKLGCRVLQSMAYHGPLRETPWFFSSVLKQPARVDAVSIVGLSCY